MDINKKHLIITGATGGLGGSLIKSLSDYDCTITAIGRNNDILKKLEKEFDVIPLCLDLTTAKGREKFSDYVKNNPDIYISKSFEKASLKCLPKYPVPPINKTLTIEIISPIPS